MLSTLRRRLLAIPDHTFPVWRLAPKLRAHLRSTNHLRTAYPAEFYPKLHAHSPAAWKALPQTQPAQANGLLAQARRVEKAPQAAADRVAREGRSLIPEGVHLVPGCSIQPVCAVLLAVRSPQEHLRRWQQRARATRRDPSDALAYFSQVRALQQALEHRARLHHVPIVPTDALDAEQALLALLKRRSQGVRP